MAAVDGSAEGKGEVMKKLTDEELEREIEKGKARCSELMAALAMADSALLACLVEQAERECKANGHKWTILDDDWRTCRRCGTESKEHLGNWEERSACLAGIGHIRMEDMAWQRWMKKHESKDDSKK